MTATVFVTVTMASDSFREHLEVILAVVTTGVMNFDGVVLS